MSIGLSSDLEYSWTIILHVWWIGKVRTVTCPLVFGTFRKYNQTICLALCHVILVGFGSMIGQIVFQFVRPSCSWKDKFHALDCLACSKTFLLARRSSHILGQFLICSWFNWTRPWTIFSLINTNLEGLEYAKTYCLVPVLIKFGGLITKLYSFFPCHALRRSFSKPSLLIIMRTLLCFPSNFGGLERNYSGQSTVLCSSLTAVLD